MNISLFMGFLFSTGYSLDEMEDLTDNKNGFHRREDLELVPAPNVRVDIGSAMVKTKTANASLWVFSNQMPGSSAKSTDCLFLSLPLMLSFHHGNGETPYLLFSIKYLVKYGHPKI
jgi:hypothetical protein